MLAPTPAPLGQRHVPVISSSQRPAQRSRFPRLPRDTSCYRLSSRAQTPRHAKRNAVVLLLLSPAPLHPDGNLLVTQKSPPAPAAPSSAVTLWCSRGSAGLCFSGHLNLINFPDGFPGFPLLLPGRERAGGCQDTATLPRPLAPPAHWHREYFYFLAASCHSPPQEGPSLRILWAKAGTAALLLTTEPCRDHLGGGNEQTPGGNGDTIPGQVPVTGQ